MKVLKFGGTSVASADSINNVISILKEASTTNKIAVVVSALGGTTDKLLEAGMLAIKGDKAYLDCYDAIRKRHLETISLLIHTQNKDHVIAVVENKLIELKQYLKGVFLLKEFSNRTKDAIVGFGELLSSYIIFEALKQAVDNSALKDSRELIITDANFTHATVQRQQTYHLISEYFKSSNADIVILPGFVSKSTHGENTTLGRGGSDYTAALIAAATNASILEIWTDVSGMYTANPKLVKQAYPIPEISYQEAMELSHFGAKVLYAPTVQPVLSEAIPLRIKNTFKPNDQGTLIAKHVPSKNGLIKGISHVDNVALLTLEGNGMVGVPGFAQRLFSVLSQNKINIVIITQASSEHSICIGIYSADAKKAKQLVDDEFAYEISLNKIKPLYVEDHMAVVATVGDNMKNHQGISGKMFSALGQNNVNVRAIAQGASERNISAVIASNDVKKALNTIHNRFFEKQIKTLNLFIVGVGNVGAILLKQIKQQHAHLKEQLLLNISVVGISNSKKMIFNRQGLNLDTWQTDLNNGEHRSNEAFFEKVKSLNLSNSIYIDITASAAIAATYRDYLKESISVIACNKIACSSEFSEYKHLKRLSREYNTALLFETNVGAGLPIISTLNNLVNSGDEIHAIQAVLSGSLNFIFNNYNDTTTFHDVVKQAQTEGYTEPDPRIDLSGVDVARKILILARESGYSLNLEDIENSSFLPTKSLEANSVTTFYNTLKTHENHFKALYNSAKAKGCQLKYVAEFNNGKAKVGLKAIDSKHPFYNLEGKDNIVLFYTSRYPNQPMIIKGAGAGAAVTASGLFADIISLKRY